MFIRSLRVEHCRIISHLSIDPAEGFNLITGPNGSGKTSLLEAISLLATGRSFRTTAIRSVVQEGQKSLIVSASTESDTGLTNTIAIERGRDIQRLRINSAPENKLSTLAEQIPLQIITPDSIDLVMGSPRRRRSFIDWGLFHVEPHFLNLNKKYALSLRSRNALLKKRHCEPREMVFWNQQLAECGEAITHIRQQYLAQLIDHYNRNLSSIVNELDQLQIGFEYKSGWKRGVSLFEAIEQSGERERSVGHTVVGPQEADLLIFSREGRAKQSLSRGQAKLLSIALYLSQLSHLDERREKRAILLIDDLFSELDQINSDHVFNYLHDSGHQIFSTSTDMVTTERAHTIQRFHVEQGEFVGSI